MRRWHRSAKIRSAPTAEVSSNIFTKEQSSLCSFLSWAGPFIQKQNLFNRGGREAKQEELVFTLETVATFALEGHGFGYFQKCPRGVRQVCVFAVDEPQFAFQL